ncbi:MAG: DUF6132 family protein [Chitinophagales bacterium]
MKKFVDLYRLPLAGLVTGALMGWLYWRLVGCSSGQCAITSNPVNSTAYGALMGLLLFSSFRKS